MLNNILNLEGVAVLCKKQQKQITGGQTSCAYYNGQTGQVDFIASAEDAQSMLSHSSDHWCCNSCSSASWYPDSPYMDHSVLQ